MFFPIRYITSAIRFDIPLYQNWHWSFCLYIWSLLLAFIKEFLTRFFFLHFCYSFVYDSPPSEDLLQALQLLNNILINIRNLIDFWAEFCWLIPRHTKRYSAWWLNILLKLIVTFNVSLWSLIHKDTAVFFLFPFVITEIHVNHFEVSSFNISMGSFNIVFQHV